MVNLSPDYQTRLKSKCLDKILFYCPISESRATTCKKITTPKHIPSWVPGENIENDDSV